MDILVITWNFPPRRGGIENLIGRLCIGLRKKHAVFVITSHSASDPSMNGAIFRPRWRGLLMFFLYALFRGAVVLYRNPNIEVILGGSALVTPLVLILARLFRRRAVVQTHGLDLIYPKIVYQLLCVRWIRFCDRIIANSRYTASSAEQKGARASSIVVVPPGVNWERFSSSAGIQPVKRRLGLEGKKILLFIGRLARRKGVKEFIQGSFPQIVQAVPTVCFVIVGDNPRESLTHREDLLTEIQATIAELGLETHVRLIGWVDNGEVVRICQIADLLVLPVLPMESDVEGFGIVVLEAAAAGTPAVATRSGGIPDAIEHGRSGILVEPGDYEGLSQSIVTLLTDEGRRRAMGEYAKKRAKEAFSWETILEKYEIALSSAP